MRAGRRRQSRAGAAVDRQRVDLAIAGVGLGRRDQELRAVGRELRVGDLPGAARELARRRLRRGEIGDVEVHPAVALGQEPEPRRAGHEAHRGRRRAGLVEGADPGGVLHVLDDPRRAGRRAEGDDVAMLVVGRDDDGRGVAAVGGHHRQAPEERTGARIDLGAAQRHRGVALRRQIHGHQPPAVLRVADVAPAGQQLRIARSRDVGRDVGAARRRRLVDDQRVGHRALVREHQIVDRLPLADGQADHRLRVLAGLRPGLARFVLADDGEELRLLRLEELLAVRGRRAGLGRPGVGELLEGRAGRLGAGLIGPAIDPHPVQPAVADEGDGAAAVRPARVRFGGRRPGDKRPRPGHRIHHDDVAVDDAGRAAVRRVPLAAGGRGQAALVIGQTARLARPGSGGRRRRGAEAGAGHLPRDGLVLAARTPLEIQALGVAGPAQGARRVADQPRTTHDAVDGELEGRRRQAPGRRTRAGPGAGRGRGRRRNAAWSPHRGAKRRMALTIIGGRAVRLGPPAWARREPWPDARGAVSAGSYTIWRRTCRRTMRRPGASICSVPVGHPTPCFLH